MKQKETKPIIPRLTKEKEAEIFKALAHKSYKDVGRDFGLHLIYNDDNAKMTSVVYGISRKIKKAPELWGISPDTVEVVQQQIERRTIKKNPALRAELALQEESFRDKLDTMRDTVAEIITRKLKKYNTTKGHEDVQLRDLKDLLAMAVDKGRLLRGESTENLVKLSKLDTDNMSPEDAMKVVLKAREVLTDGKK